MHTFTTSLNYEDYLAANWLMMRRRMLWRGVIRFTVTATILYSILGVSIRFLSQGPSVNGAFAEIVTGFCLTLAVIAALSVYWLWCIPRSARKAWPQLHLDGLPTVHEFDETGIRIANDRGTANFEWHMLSSWTEDDRLLLMFRTKSMSHVVPKAQVSKEQLDALRTALIDAGVPTRC